MRILLLITFLLMSTSYAFQIVNQEVLTEESLKLQVKQDARLPVQSKASAGKVIKHKLQMINFTYSLFIIGDDAMSYQWLKDHAAELDHNHALGFVTNISDKNRLFEFQQLINLPILPANVDDLMNLFQESNYPLIFHEGEIWQ